LNLNIKFSLIDQINKMQLNNDKGINSEHDFNDRGLAMQQKGKISEEPDPKTLSLPERLRHHLWSARKDAYQQLIYILTGITNLN